jgi:hypothetical protein
MSDQHEAHLPPLPGPPSDPTLARTSRARATQLEAIRLAHDATRQWRAVARQIADAGLGIQEAARLMGVSPSRVRDLLDP